MGLFSLCVFISLLCFVVIALGKETISWREIPFEDIVTKAEYYTRKLASSSKRSRRGANHRLRHDAVVVTTKTNGRWLIEKGKGYSSGSYRDSNTYPYKDGNTIATRWRNETQSEYRWTNLKSKELICRRTVLDFMEVAFLYYGYNVIFPNCQHAAKTMWKLAEQRCSNYLETSSYGKNVKTSLFIETYIILDYVQNEYVSLVSLIDHVQTECVSLIDRRHIFTPDNFKSNKKQYRQLLCNVVMPLDLKNEPDFSVFIFRLQANVYYHRYMK